MEDKVVAISQAMLEERYADLDIDNVRFSHFPAEIYSNIRDADVVIVFNETTARVMRNRFSNRNSNFRADSIGNWIRARLYRMDR